MPQYTYMLLKALRFSCAKEEISLSLLSLAKRGQHDSRYTILPSLETIRFEKMELLAVAKQEHEWRELLQEQLADHRLKLNYPGETKANNVMLEKFAVQERSCLIVLSILLDSGNG